VSETIIRNFRIVIDVAVTVDPTHAPDTATWDVEKERALLDAVMADSQVFQRYLSCYAIMALDESEVQDTLNERYGLGLDSGAEDAVIRPVLQRLPDPIRRHFEKAMRDELLAEATGWFGASFETAVRAVALHEVSD